MSVTSAQYCCEPTNALKVKFSVFKEEVRKY